MLLTWKKMALWIASLVCGVVFACFAAPAGAQTYITDSYDLEGGGWRVYTSEGGCNNGSGQLDNEVILTRSQLVFCPNEGAGDGTGPAIDLTASINFTLNEFGYFRAGWGKGATINGNITGDGNLGIAHDSGAITLTGTNTYTGNTIIGIDSNQATQAMLILGSSGALPAGTTVVFNTVNGNAVLDLNSFSSSVSKLVNGDGTNKPTVQGVGTLTTTTNEDWSLSWLNGANAANSVFSKGGTGTLTLNGTNDNSGLMVSVASGTLILAKESSAGAHAVSSIVGVAPTATLQLAGTGGSQVYDDSTVSDMNGTFNLNGRSETIKQLSGSGKVINTVQNTRSTLTIGTGDLSAYAFTGTIGDPDSKADSNIRLAFGNDGSAKAIPSVTNYHTGGTVLTGGVKQIAGGAQMDFFGYGPVVLDGVTLAIQDNTIPFTNTFQPGGVDIELAAGGGGFRAWGQGQTNVTGNVTGVGNLWITYDTANRYFTFSGENVYEGNTLIGYKYGGNNANDSRSHLRLGSDTALPQTTTVVFGTLYAGSELDMAGHNATVTKLALDGENGAAARNINNSVGDGTDEKVSTLTMKFSADDTPEWTFPEVTVGNEIVLRKDGAGTLTINSSAVSNNKNFQLAGGKLKLSDAGLLDGKTLEIVASGTGGQTLVLESTDAYLGTYDIAGEQTFTLEGSGTGNHTFAGTIIAAADVELALKPGATMLDVTSAISLETDKPFTISARGAASDTGKATVSGKISGAGPLTLATDAGSSLTISGNNDYTGGTNISGNIIAGSASAFGAEEITLTGQTNLTLDRVSISNDIDLAGKELVFRATNGETATTSGSISGSGGKGALFFELADLAPNMLLTEAGSMSIHDAILSISCSDLLGVRGNTYYLFDAVTFYDGDDAIVDITDYLGDMLDFSQAGGAYFWLYGYDEGDGPGGIWIQLNDNAVPEPATWLLLLLAIPAIWRFRRRAAT